MTSRSGPATVPRLAALAVMALAACTEPEPDTAIPDDPSEFLAEGLHDVAIPEMGMAVMTLDERTHEAEVERCVLGERVMGYRQATGEVSIFRLEASHHHDGWHTQINAERRVQWDEEDYGPFLAVHEADALRLRVTSPDGRQDIAYLSGSRDHPGGPVTLMPESEPGELPLLRIVRDGEIVRATALGEMPEGVMEPEVPEDLFVGHGPFTFAVHCNREEPER